jgi:hypothetical protein
MTNANCLQDIKCPKCGGEDRFHIQALVTTLVTDDGAEAADGNFEWDENSPIKCLQCNHTGRVRQFWTKAGAA